ncbi:hypothetical protein [Baaleninema simplex]|uniref:hypothetical protein n=1 Tax=Baaleninema simplex TaxID=2862350 RepID=UPI0011819E75|nr:hypothetical protein [Baaleninema simplex]
MMNQSQLLSALFAIAFCVGGLQGCSTPDTDSAADTSSETTTETTTPVEASSASSDVTADPTTESPSDAQSQTTDAETVVEEDDPLAAFDEKQVRLLSDTAKFLAGIPVGKDSPLATQQQTTAWNDHAAYLESAWQQLEAQQLSKARSWAQSELQFLNERTPNLFYPFSGPDFLYAYTFFPEATDYVLVALEPVGRVPSFENLSPAGVQQRLSDANQSLYAILQYSFFRTNAMAEDLDEQGVLPILMLFMGRTNQRVLEVQHVGLDESANLQPVEPGGAAAQGWIDGVKITFVPEGETVPKTLYYFSTDLSDEGLAQTPEFLKFVGQFDRPVTYLKAASYLMHNDYFSQIRNTILSSSQAVLQDDSGIPLRFFDPSNWNRQFYGSYVRPIDLFAQRYQADLREAYATDPTVAPLNFGIGYKYYQDANLMLAIPE